MNKVFCVLAIGCIALFGSESTPLIAQADEPSDIKPDAAQLAQNAPKKLRAAKSLEDYAAARRDLLQAVAADPKSASAQFWLAEATRWATRYASTLNTPTLNADFDFALLDADEAIRRYSLAIELDPKGANAYFGRGSFYLQRNTPTDNTRAEEDFSRAIALDPKMASAYLARALARGRSGKPVLATLLADYDKAILLGIPDSGEDEAYTKVIAPRLKATAYSGRGTIYLQQHQTEMALADFDKALSLDPNNLNVLIQRVEVLVQKGQADKALEELNNVLAKQPDAANALAMRAEIYRVKNVHGRAREDMRRALQFDETLMVATKDPVYNGLISSIEGRKRGDEWLAQGAFDEAMAAYSNAIELDKENAWAYRGLAAVKMRKGDLKGAQADLDVGLKLQPEDVKLLTARGQVLARQGQYSAALADLQKATQLAPDDAAAWEQIGIVQQAQGDYVAAEKSYDTAVGFAALSALGPGNQSTQLALMQRLIVRAARGLNQDWKANLEKLTPQQLQAGAFICGIELKKQPESQPLLALQAALTEKQTGTITN